MEFFLYALLYCHLSHTKACELVTCTLIIVKGHLILIALETKLSVQTFSMVRFKMNEIVIKLESHCSERSVGIALFLVYVFSV